MNVDGDASSEHDLRKVQLEMQGNNLNLQTYLYQNSKKGSSTMYASAKRLFSIQKRNGPSGGPGEVVSVIKKCAREVAKTKNTYKQMDAQVLVIVKDGPFLVFACFVLVLLA